MGGNPAFKKLMFLPFGIVAGAVLFLPILVGARDQVKGIHCANNLRKIGRAIELYRSDFDGRYPFAADATDKLSPSLWASRPELAQLVESMPMVDKVLSNYVESPSVFQCPADNGSVVLDTNFTTPFVSEPSVYARHGSSYLYRTEIAFRAASNRRFEISDRANVLFDACGHWHADVRPVTRDEPSEVFRTIASQYRYHVLRGDGSVDRVNYNRLQQRWATRL